MEIINGIASTLQPGVKCNTSGSSALKNNLWLKENLFQVLLFQNW